MRMLQVCPSTGRPCDCSAGAPTGTSSDDKDAMYGSTALKTPTAEPIFPPELRKRAVPELSLPGRLAAWYRCHFHPLHMFSVTRSLSIACLPSLPSRTHNLCCTFWVELRQR